MPSNIEIKARLGRLADIEPTVARLATEGPVEIVQDDCFFPCPNGRLKLRAFADGTGELIQYARSDAQGPKESSYVRSPTASPDTLREALGRALGQLGRVRKRRTLYLVGRTRVHLDEVEGLGPFLELEVVMAEDEPLSAGVAEADALMQALGVGPHQLVEGAYMDLLRAQKN